MAGTSPTAAANRGTSSTTSSPTSAGLAEAVAPGGRGSSFADEVDPAEDASAIDRLAAYAGRIALV